MANVQIWNKKNIKKNSIFPHFPITSILRSTLSNSYYHNTKKIKKNYTILDIGTLYLNNLKPFHDRSCKIYGTEVTEESCAIAKSIAKKNKIKCIIKKGLNSNLPFKKNFFDLILSINTLHYEEGIRDIKRALLEFKRVLKPGGCLVVETVGPKHFMCTSSEKIKNDVFKLKLKKDIRNNNNFFFFNSKKKIIKIFSKYFKKIEIAEILEEYPKKKINFFDIKCFK